MISNLIFEQAWFTQRRASAEEDNYRVAIVDMSSDSSVEGANEIGSTIDDVSTLMKIWSKC
jgi:hypothetical protein